MHFSLFNVGIVPTKAILSAPSGINLFQVYLPYVHYLVETSPPHKKESQQV